jgi:hypothetical protein
VVGLPLSLHELGFAPLPGRLPLGGLGVQAVVRRVVGDPSRVERRLLDRLDLVLPQVAVLPRFAVGEGVDGVAVVSVGGG